MIPRKERNKVFNFKQFAVNQQGSAMKINTDGVLLAAYLDSENPKRILDIGAGTGVIALMLAQRFPEASVEAVEINPEAAACTLRNFNSSPFASRLKVYCMDFNAFLPTQPYDLLVTNPPFFINSLKNEVAEKTTARHASSTFFEALFDWAYRWISEGGSFFSILPLTVLEQLERQGCFRNWYMEAKTFIRSFPDSEVIRVVLKLIKRTSKAPEGQAFGEKEFIIYREKGEYTEEYRQLLAPFFLEY